MISYISKRNKKKVAFSSCDCNYNLIPLVIVLWWNQKKEVLENKFKLLWYDGESFKHDRVGRACKVSISTPKLMKLESESESEIIPIIGAW